MKPDDVEPDNVPVIEKPATVMPYRNELPGLELYQKEWASLMPLVATAEDLHAVLGLPDEMHDLDDYSAPYPGDDKAVQPVWTYDLNPQWQLLVYFGRSSLPVQKTLSPEYYDKLYSLELIPTDKRILEASTIPTSFAQRKVSAADASWVEYSLPSGLQYEVYNRGERENRLNRVVYGPSIDALAGSRKGADGL
ncbi:MAG: hypothetical protein JKY56_24520 [Kofleriaceae bacterium]|nr:hypothetical protein [Kofleriaceae bacterium]